MAIPLRPVLLSALLSLPTLPMATAQEGQNPGTPQDPSPTASQPTDSKSQPDFIRLEWPQHKETVVAMVGEQGITLGEVIEHHEANHAPGLQAFLGTPAGNLYFESPWPSRWVRWYADSRALAAMAEARGLGDKDIKPYTEGALREAFRDYLDAYARQLQANGRGGELDQKRVDLLLDGFQREQGLLAERDGWLQLLEPADASEAELYDYYRLNPWFFGGKVKARHILVSTRHAGTGIRLTGDAMAAAKARLEDVQTRLKRDPGSFAEVARLLSQDPATAKKGGELPELPRLSSRLPAELTRTAWLLEDGAISAPVESPFGVHIIQREERMMREFVVFDPKLYPRIRRVRRECLHEDLLFKARREQVVQLLY